MTSNTWLDIPMQTAKEALLKAGKIQAITRGRISKDNHAWLAEQVAKGVKFSDYGENKVSLVKSSPKQRPATKTVSLVKAKSSVDDTGDSGIYSDLVRYHRDEYKAVALDGKVYGMAECCNNCRVSLVQCACGNPTILGGIAVKIVAR